MLRRVFPFCGVVLLACVDPLPQRTQGSAGGGGAGTQDHAGGTAASEAAGGSSASNSGGATQTAGSSGTEDRGGKSGSGGIAGEPNGGEPNGGFPNEGGSAGDLSEGGEAGEGTGGVTSGGGAGSGGISSSGGSSGGLPGSTPAGGEGTGGRPVLDRRMTPNLFTTLLGKPQAEVDEKVALAVNRFFGIGTEEPNTLLADRGYRCYYELPQASDMAFIWAADSADIRSEGVSYGMMIAVQMNLQTQFDKLWRFAKTYMQYPADSTMVAWRHYFKWQSARIDTSDANSWDITYDAETVPAPDGEEYFAAALYLAHERWGSAGDIHYRSEAHSIATAMLHNQFTDDGEQRFPVFHTEQNMVVFVPLGSAYEFTDPSYHLPAFYELFAAVGPSRDTPTWKNIAAVSRDYLVKSAHPTTGLHPDYATFDGVPTVLQDGDGHDSFRYDAWRVPLNMAIDFAWFSADPRMKQQIEKYQAFFTGHLATNNVKNSLFAVDGSAPSGGGSTALTATLAAASMASGAENRAKFVENLWNVQQQSGRYRYYQQGVYLLGLLAASGKFQTGW